MCCRVWLRGLAYLIFFTVLARSPRRASSKFVALAAIVIYGLNFLISFLFTIVLQVFMASIGKHVRHPLLCKI